MISSKVSITVKFGQQGNLIPKLEPNETLLDIHSMQISMNEKIALEGKLLTIENDLLNYGTSYFLIRKKGILKKGAIPLLFADENLSFIGEGLILSPKKESRGRQAIFATERRLIIIQSKYALSFWFEIDFKQYIDLLKINFDVSGELLTSIKNLQMQFLESAWPFGKQVIIGWIKKKNSDILTKKPINPFTIKGNIIGKGSYKKYSEKLSNSILERVENGSKTNFHEILAMEDYCLNSAKKFYHPISASFQSVVLKHGRLNLGKKKEIFN